MKKEKKQKNIAKIGGQALMEGVMMRGVTSMAMAVRTPSGEIAVETTRFKKIRPWYSRVPILRGVVSFVSSLVTGVTTLSRSIETAFPDEETPSKGGMAFSMVLGFLLAIGLFVLLPMLPTYLLKQFADFDNFIYVSLIEGGTRLIIFILYLLLASRLKDIRRTFMYHGAEHRTINCFEKGMELTVENVQKCSTRHNRCGTTFLFFVIIVSIVIGFFLNWGLHSIGGIVYENFFIKFLIRLACLPLIAGLSYELLRGLAALPDNWFTNVLRAPGLALQRLTTYPPEDEMAEVALASFKVVYDMDANPAIPEIKFGEYFVNGTKDRIRALAPEAEDCEADIILTEVTGRKKSELTPHFKLTEEQYLRAVEIAKRRGEGEPLAYILGHWEFFGLKLKVDNSVLIPRQETELLAELAIKELENRGENPTALDLCTGSGCIALALTKFVSNAAVTAVDISDDALETAKENLKDTSVRVIKSDLFSAFEGTKFDVIVSNPPYVTDAEMDALSKEVRREPRLALEGGADGLDFYRRIAKEAEEYLAVGGVLALEIGCTQGDAVKELLNEAGYRNVTVIKDYGGLDRIVRAEKV